MFASTELRSFANVNFSQGGSGRKWGMCAFGRCSNPVSPTITVARWRRNFVRTPRTDGCSGTRGQTDGRKS